MDGCKGEGDPFSGRSLKLLTGRVHLKRKPIANIKKVQFSFELYFFLLG